MIRTLVLALCTTLLCAPVAAQTSDWDDDELVTSLDASDLEALVRFNGHEVISDGGENPLSVSARTPEGVAYGMFLTSCTDGKDCRGVRMQVVYNQPEGTTAARVNAANLRYVTTSVIHDANAARVYIIRYLIMDFGVTRKNIRANLAVFMQTIPGALGILAGESQASE